MAAPGSASGPWGRTRARLSYILRETEDEPRHRFGINKLRLGRSGSTLYSAGRDGLVRQWDLHDFAAEPQWAGNFELHTDWVNDIAVAEDVNYLISASSDNSLKICSLENRAFVAVLHKHEDYVKAVDYSPETKCFVSVGLDRRMVLWDMSSLREVTHQVNHDHPESIYSLSYNGAAHIIATGSSDKVIRLWDPRSLRRIGALKGHDDVIKALAVSSDGTKLLSGCSDYSLKLWDLGQQRCISTYACHTDSVWALRTDPEFRRAFSGGRDGAVYLTDLTVSADSACSQLVLQVPEPILDIEATPDRSNIWVSTTSSNITNWPLPDSAAGSEAVSLLNGTAAPGINGSAGIGAATAVPPTGAGAAAAAGTEDDDASGTGSRRPRSGSTGSDPADTVVPLSKAPHRVIHGAPGIVAHRLLPDRIHVITRDTAGSVCRWSILHGVKVQTFPPGTDFESVVEELSREKVARPAWCAIDTRVGSLTVHMSENECFSAWALVQPRTTDDSKFNLGATLVQALLKPWQETQRFTFAMQGQRDALPPQERLKDRLRQEALETGIAHALFDVSGHLPIFITDQSEAPCVTLVCKVREAGRRNTYTQMHTALPAWVRNCVLDTTRPLGNAPPPPQVQFYLTPIKGGPHELPPLPANFLMCLGCLPVWRLARHVFNTLAEARQAIAAAWIQAPEGDESTVNGGGTVRVVGNMDADDIGFEVSQFIEILCLDKPLEPMMDLQYVKSRVWKRSEDPQLSYRWCGGVPPAPGSVPLSTGSAEA